MCKLPQIKENVIFIFLGLPCFNYHDDLQFQAEFTGSDGQIQESVTSSEYPCKRQECKYLGRHQLPLGVHFKRKLNWKVVGGEGEARLSPRHSDM